MIHENQYDDLIGRTAVDRDGNKIGKVGQIFLDDETNRAEWATVNTGLFGMNENFVPLEQAEFRGNDKVFIPVTKDHVGKAPNIDVSEGDLAEDDERKLYQHYGMNYQPWSGRSQESGDDAMTRSEERLNVGTQKVQTGRARLRKYIVTENVTQTVPVTKEKVRVEREPITDENRDEAHEGPDLTESEHEITLSEERPVISKETVPVEQVKLTKEQQTEQQQVSGTVRKEQIDQQVDDPQHAEH